MPEGGYSFAGRQLGVLRRSIRSYMGLLFIKGFFHGLISFVSARDERDVSILA